MSVPTHPCSRCTHNRADHEYEGYVTYSADYLIAEEGYVWGSCEKDGCACGGWLPVLESMREGK